MRDPDARFRELLGSNAAGAPPLPKLDAALAERILARTEHVPFFAHSYALIRNLDHGGMTTNDLLDFAHASGLDGLCLHIDDGGPTALGKMSTHERGGFHRRCEGLGLRLHLEISSSEKTEVDRAAACARDLGITNIRLYARHEGRLSKVLERVYTDLCHAAEVANRHDLHFDYEQHEDMKAAEIAGLLARVGEKRINALFDYTNALNAHEEPLDALFALAPFIRQAHIKGGRKTVEGRGWGQLGVAQGSEEDELPGNRMLYELLMLGEKAPQVICFALEQEVGYVAPPFRLEGEGPDPLIRFRPPSETPVDGRKPLAGLLQEERRWAAQQVNWNRSVVAELRAIGMAASMRNEEPRLPQRR
jgi:sugar phosphate isomerase/epimerase